MARWWIWVMGWVILRAQLEMVSDGAEVDSCYLFGLTSRPMPPRRITPRHRHTLKDLSWHHRRPASSRHNLSR
jgi:hypothetical protein